LDLIRQESRINFSLAGHQFIDLHLIYLIRFEIMDVEHRAKAFENGGIRKSHINLTTCATYKWANRKPLDIRVLRFGIVQHILSKII
jgi:hypothetical protein